MGLFLPYAHRDHPRLRGEYDLNMYHSLHLRGSPPPTRGIRNSPVLYEPSVGITPAYAGNTNNFLLECFRGRDHPRLRGEYLKALAMIFSGEGSPPPTRGIRTTDYAMHRDIRITPAYAGNTLFICVIFRVA